MAEPSARHSGLTSAAPPPPASPSTPRPRRRWLAIVERTVGHPLTQLTVAGVLMATSFFEASETFIDDFSEFRVRATHGLLLVGLWQVVRTIPDLIDGIERYLEFTGDRKRES